MQGLIIIGKPLLQTSENRMALFNESMITVYLYVLMTLSGFQVNAFYSESGTALMSVVIATVSVNFLYLLT